MKPFTKRAVSILLVLCLVASCSLCYFTIELHAAGISASLAWSDTENLFTVTESNQEDFTKDVTVSATFPDNDNFVSLSKKIKITLAPGLSWSDNASTSIVSSSFYNISRSSDSQTYITGESMKNGSYVYTLNDIVKSISFTIKVKYDTRTSFTAIADAIHMTASYTDTSNNVISSEDSIDAAITLTDTNAAQTGITLTQKTTCGNVSMNVSGANRFGVRSSYEKFWKQVELTISVPKDVTYIRNLQPTNWTYTDTVSSTNHTYVFQTTNQMGNAVSINPVFQIPDTYAEGSSIPINYTHAKVTFYDGSVLELDTNYTYTFVITNDLGLSLNGVKASYSSGSSIVPSVTHKIVWTRPDTYNGTSDIYKDAECVLGYYQLGNDAANSFSNKEFTMQFDTEKIRVNGVKLYVADCTSSINVNVTYKRNAASLEETKTVTLTPDNLPTDYTEPSASTYHYYYLYAGDPNVGIGKDATITKIEYTIASIPENLNKTSFYYYGSITDYDALKTEEAVTNVSITDPADSDYVIKANSLTSLDTSEHMGIASFKQESSSSKTYIAGNTIHTTLKVYGRQYAHAFTPTPIFYIRDETGLGIKNLKITTFSQMSDYISETLLNTTPGSSKNPYGILVTELERDISGARIYKVDTTPVAASSNPYAAAIGLYDSKYASTFRTVQLVVDYDVVTSKAYYDNATPHKINEKFYVEDPGNSFTGFYNFENAYFVQGDTYDVNKNNSSTDSNVMYAKDTGTTYTIKNEYGIQLSTKIQQTDSASEFINVTADSDTININSRTVTVKTNVTNTSFLSVNHICLYVPIPKSGEDWGKYLMPGDTLDVSTSLVREIANPNAAYFQISYGKVSLPSDTTQITSALNDFSDWMDYDDTKREQYNCIRITSKQPLPCNQANSSVKTKFIADNSYDFNMNLEYELQNQSGTFYSIWRPFLSSQFLSTDEMVSLHYFGSYVGVNSTVTGTIRGLLWHDTNKNGLQDASETDLSDLGDWNIQLYRADDYQSNPVTAAVLKATTTKASGAYLLSGLNFPENYVIVVTNKDGDSYEFTQTATPYSVAVNDGRHISNSMTDIHLTNLNPFSEVNFGIGKAVPAESPSPSASIPVSTTPAPSASTPASTAPVPSASTSSDPVIVPSPSTPPSVTPTGSAKPVNSTVPTKAPVVTKSPGATKTPGPSASVPSKKRPILVENKQVLTLTDKKPTYHLNIKYAAKDAVITYHACSHSIVSIHKNGKITAKKTGRSRILVTIKQDGKIYPYIAHVIVKSTAKKHYKTITYKNIKYHLHSNGTASVANNSLNKSLPNKVVIPSKLTYQLKTYNITAIEEDAFRDITSITEISIGKNVVSIDSTAFINAKNLAKFYVSKQNKHYASSNQNKGALLLSKNKKTLIAYPSARGAITLPGYLTKMGEYSMACAKITSLVIPANMKTIGACTFAHTNQLKTVTFQSIHPPVMEEKCLFDYSSDSLKICIPKASFNAYKTSFKNAYVPKGTQYIAY